MKLITNILLMLVAMALGVVLFPLGFLITIILLFFKDPREYFEHTPDYPFGIAYGIDILGNVICGDLLNIILTKRDAYKYGKRGETISSATGKNYLTHKLTMAGLALNWILDKIEKDHTIKSIQIFPNEK